MIHLLINVFFFPGNQRLNHVKIYPCSEGIYNENNLHSETETQNILGFLEVESPDEDQSWYCFLCFCLDFSHSGYSFHHFCYHHPWANPLVCLHYLLSLVRRQTF